MVSRFSIEQARQHIEDRRQIARSQERQADELATELEDLENQDDRKWIEADRSAALQIARTIDKECDDLLAQLPREDESGDQS